MVPSLREAFLKQARRIMVAEVTEPKPYFGPDSSKGRRELGIKCRRFEEMVKDSGGELFEIEARLAGRK
jgi:hypothetical protein